MKIYTTTKLTVLTLLLTASGLLAEGPPACPDAPPPGHDNGQFRQKPRQRKGGPGQNFRKDEMRKQGREAMEWLKEKDPEKFEKLNKLRHADGKAFFKEMHTVMKGFMKEKHPEMFKMHEQQKKNNQKIRKLGKQYEKAETPEEKADIEKKLKEVLVKQFDSKQKLKSKEVKKLESRTSKLKESLETRLKNKESIINTRFKSITEGKEAVEW